MTSVPCPWLGTDQDRATRHAEPAEAHLCYAQQPPAEVNIPHQSAYCLAGTHAACRYYAEPARRPAVSLPAGPLPSEDEVGPPPERPLTAGQILLWAIAGLLVVAAAFYFGAGGLKPSAGARASSTLPPGAAATPTPGATPTPTPLPLEPSAGPTAAALPVAGPGRPALTPTPHPGGKVHSLTPAAGAAGWVASDQQRGNHFGDSFLYAGVYDGVTYHAAIQFDLSRLPRGAPIYYAALQLSGLDAARLGADGTWEVRLLSPIDGAAGAETWARAGYQEVHNSTVAWSLVPTLAAADLKPDGVYLFELGPEQLRDLEQRLVGEQYELVFRLDGPLAGANSLFAWDSGSGPASRGNAPKLLVSAGAPPLMPLATASPAPTDTLVPTDTPEWFVVTNTPTPGNAMTAAAVAARQTAWATTTGTATPLPLYVATATPRYIVVTNTPTPGNAATAQYWRGLATANVVLTGTSTPRPPNLVTATPTPRATWTPVFIWLDDLTPPPTPTPTPTMPPIPRALKGKILFLSDRFGAAQVFALEPSTGRVAIVTGRWPYDAALRTEAVSPDGHQWALVQNDGGGRPQVFVYSEQYHTSWQLTFNTGISYGPVWSPRGGQIAFVSNESTNDEVFVVDTDGTHQQRLTMNEWEWDKHPSWSPDGSQIVYYSNAITGHLQLWIMDADGRNQHVLLASQYNDWDPVWVK